LCLVGILLVLALTALLGAQLTDVIASNI